VAAYPNALVMALDAPPPKTLKPLRPDI